VLIALSLRIYPPHKRKSPRIQQVLLDMYYIWGNITSKKLIDTGDVIQEDKQLNFMRREKLLISWKQKTRRRNLLKEYQSHLFLPVLGSMYHSFILSLCFRNHKALLIRINWQTVIWVNIGIKKNVRYDQVITKIW
jgi:hypothetical protein